MNPRRDNAGRRPARRLLAGAVLSAGVLAATSAQADAATTATFGSGALSVSGDALDNSIAISRDVAGKILVNGGAVAVSGGTPTVANTAVIRVYGQGGDVEDPCGCLTGIGPQIAGALGAAEPSP